MSYQVLARKWRPQGFEDVAGQEHVTRILRNAIRLGRVPHAILLCGPRGVGKTTLARIIARCLNCDTGPTDQPCGSCAPCEEIAAGRALDVREIDAASRTGVDDVRELIDSVHYAAAPGKRRIYIVDEVHMLSSAAFNALLKTLEEPPPQSLFLFATTNPEKIPFTVLSRCQRHDLRRLASGAVCGRLREVAQAEGIAVSDASLREIAREGDGSLRDALTLLDQIVAAAGVEVDDARVAEVLDLVDRRTLTAIAAACIGGDPAAALAAAARATVSGTDPARLARTLIQLLRDLVVLAVAPDAPDLVEGSATELAELRELAARSDPSQLRRMFRALLREQEDLAWAPQPMAVLEMALVRLATLAPGAEAAELLTRLDALETRLATSGSGDGFLAGGGGSEPPPPPRERGGSAPPGGGGDPPAPPQRGGEAEYAPWDAAPPSFEPANGHEPMATPGPQCPPPSREPPQPPRQLAAAPGGLASETTGGVGEQPPAATARNDEDLYGRLCAAARSENPGLAETLLQGHLLEHKGNVVRIGAADSFVAQRLAHRRSDLEALLHRHVRAGLRVEVSETAEGGGEADSAPRGGEALGVPPPLEDPRQRPAVQHALEILGGQVIAVRPALDPRR